ncbi:Uncharacterised protein [Mycobacteroides abscessus subsp. abscessus]|nr:Uncharacterised protein [Mycobacteroides abscessus subsp. abscessus]
MGEPVGCSDNKGFEGVARVEARIGCLGLVGAARAIDEVGRPGFMCASKRLGGLIDLVELDFWGRSGDFRIFARSRRRDAYTQLDILAEPAGKCLDDGTPQMPFDLVLHEARGDRKQRETLGHGEWFDEGKPGALLRGQRREARQILIVVTVELCDDGIPYRRELGIQFVSQRRASLSAGGDTSTLAPFERSVVGFHTVIHSCGQQSRPPPWWSVCVYQEIMSDHLLRGTG